MTTSRAAAAAIIGAALLLIPGARAQAAEIKVLALSAYTTSFKELVPQFERASGHKVVVQYGATPAFLKQIEAGEPFDVAILVAGPMNEAAAKGYFAGERPTLSSVGLGAAVKSGAPKPDIGTAEGFKRALLAAKGVSFLPESVNGKHFLTVFERLGIAEEMKGKLKPQTTPAQVPEAVAKGEADLALYLANTFIDAPGVDFAGPIPAEFQQTLAFNAAVSAKAKEPAAAIGFIKHLTSPASAAVLKANGMNVPAP